MKVSRRGFVTLAGAGAMATVLAGCGGGETKKEDSGSSSAASSGGKLRFVTGGESGTYYALGGVLSQYATSKEGLDVTAIVGNGSKANVQEMQDGNAELAFCQSDVMSYAWNGERTFKDEGKIDCFSAIAVLYNEQVQIVTCDPNIKSVADLKGKKVSIGASGSGVYFNAIDVLEAYGITENDITPTYQSFGDSANSLKDGQIDAAFVVAGAPTTAITDLSTSKQAYLVSLDEEHVKQMEAKNPFYITDVIPAGTYKGIDTPTTTVAVGAVVLVSDKVSDDDAYKFTKSIFEGAKNNAAAHAKYKDIDIATASAITAIPYAPGAAKYSTENGITVPSK